MQTWSFPGSAKEPYTTRWHDDSDGLIDCNCRGYLIRRKGKPFECKHVTKVIKDLQLAVVERDGRLHGTGAGTPSLLEQPQVDHAEVYDEAHAAGYIEPMLASAMTGTKQKRIDWTREQILEDLKKTVAKFLDGNWVQQVKWDGVRVILAVKNTKARAWSRPKDGSVGKPRRLPPHIALAAARLLPSGTYDGELIAGETAKSYEVSDLDKQDDQCLVLFDILKVGEESVIDLTYRQRHELLKQAIPYTDQCIRAATYSTPDAEEIMRLWDTDGEGVVLKRLDAIYVPGWRSPHWVKVKQEFYTTGTITGYEAAKNGPYSKVLLLSDAGVETSVKTKNNYWLGEFEKNPQKYIGKRLVFKHYGPTPDGKYRGPIIWDHFAGEAE
jgi:hypothetical protein